MAEYDSPWKDSLDIYFEQFLALCFPAIHQQIDWSQGYKARDTEFQKMFPDSVHQKKTVDKLMSVWDLLGNTREVLVHVEVQSQDQDVFAKRMFVYHYKLLERYNESIVSLGVLGDEKPRWHPTVY